MKNDIKTTQQLIVHMFRNNKSSQYIKNSNYNINKPNNNIVVNYKHPNLNGNIKNNGDVLNVNTNNLTNRIKYKTTKNSPERLLIQKNLSRQKNYIGLNHAQKHSSKMTTNNTLSNINKILLKTQKQNNTIKDEIIKKKILQIKDRKNMTTMNSNNNSISLSNSINHNYNHRHNNSNNNLGYFQNKGIYISKIKANKYKEFNNIQNKIKPCLQQPNSYREIKRRSNSNKEMENNINYNGKSIKCEKKGKYYNLINKYISSAAASSKQPLRQQQQKSLKNKFNTITAKMVIDINSKNSNNNTLNFHAAGTPLVENINLGKISNIGSIGNINKIKNINYNHNHNQNIKNNFIFSSTSNSLYKPKKQIKQIPNFYFDMKTLNKASYQSKQTSGK